MSFPRYARYKPSGVEWLGEVPEHWEVSRLKRMVRQFTEKTDRRTNPVGLENVESWSGRYVPSDARYEGEGIAFRPGDVLFGKLRPYLAKAMLATVSGEAVGDFLVLRPRQELRSAFLQRLLLNQDFISMVEGSTFGSKMPRASWEFVGSMVVAFPPAAEQDAITQFLDAETSKIDALIAEQQRLIELLEEKRQSLVSTAVTKGLNTNAPMKPSGVDWLGEIPAHWGVVQSRRLFAVRNEPALPEDRQLTASQRYGVVFQDDFVEREGRRVVEVIKGGESLKHVEPNDFIISMRSFQGGIEWSRLRGSTSWHYVMLVPVKHVHPAFFANLFKSITHIQALRATADLIRDGQELRYSHFVQVPLPIVPMDEQHAIAEFLDCETVQLDCLTNEAQRAIDVLYERRKALISAAVTGKIDVRGLAESDEGAEAA